jgi:hypothetical protein
VQSTFSGGNNFTTFPRRRQLQRPLMTVWWDRGLLDEGQVKKYNCKIFCHRNFKKGKKLNSKFSSHVTAI